jgi:(4S)-4-hydroxy-5-phosphonooxypentane-2,3-dione isomerase
MLRNEQKTLLLRRRKAIMHLTLVHVHVKPECRDAFIEATRLNHEGSVREPGNLRFDVLREPDDPNCFILYEAYRDVEAAAAHKTTPHYLAWRETVAGMMAEPRQGIQYPVLFPL